MTPSHNNQYHTPASPLDLQAVHDSSVFLKPMNPIVETDLRVLNFGAEQLRGSSEIPQQQVAEAVEVLEKGTYRGHETFMPETLRNAYHEQEERLTFAALVALSPETADKVKGVAGYTATTSATLGYMLELSNGKLLSAKAQVEGGMPSARRAGDAPQHGAGQASISFGTFSRLVENVESYGGPTTQKSPDEIVEEFDQNEVVLNEISREYGTKVSRSIAQNRAAKDDFLAFPDSLRAALMQHQFPVAIGVKSTFVREQEATRQNSHLLRGEASTREFRPAAESIPLNECVLAVPDTQASAIKEVLRRFGHADTVVVSLDELMQAGRLADHLQAEAA